MDNVHWFATNPAGWPWMSNVTEHDELNLPYRGSPLFEVLDPKERGVYKRWFNTALRNDQEVDVPPGVTLNVRRLLHGGVFDEVYRWRARNGEMLIIGVYKDGDSTTEYKVAQWHPTRDRTSFERMRRRTKQRSALRVALALVDLTMIVVTLLGDNVDLTPYIFVVLLLVLMLR